MDELDEWYLPPRKGTAINWNQINNEVSMSKGKANRFKPFGGYNICQNQSNFCMHIHEQRIEKYTEALNNKKTVRSNDDRATE